jgi:hypothetical protein
MSDQRSLIAFEHYRDSEQRFEHLILGVSTALCAYVGQHLEPHKIGWNSFTLEVIGLTLLVVSLVLGFKRIEAGVFLHQLNANLLDGGEKRGVLMANRGRSALNELTGDVSTPESIEKELHVFAQVIPKLQHRIGELQSRTLSCYRWRNRFLLAGFVAALVARLLAGYYP